MNLASAGSASTLLLKQSYNGQQHAAAATGSHTVAPIMRRHQQSHRPSNATTAFGATVQSQMLRSMERSGKYDGHTRSPIVGQPEDGDAPQLLQLFPQDSMNEDDKQPTTMGGGGLLEFEHLASMSLNSPPPPRPATHSLESAGGATGGGGVPHSNTLRPMPTPSTDDLLLESIAPGDSPQHSSQNTTLPPPPPLLPHRSMRQRSGSKVFILQEGDEMLGQSQQHNNNHHSADDASSSPQPLNAVAMAANNAQIGLVSGVVQEFSSFIQQQQQQPYQQQDGVNPSVARRRSTLPTTGTALQQQQQQRPSAENNHHHLHQQQGGVGGALPSSSTSSSTLPALHHEIVLDIAKTSPQHRSLMYTTLRFSRWMASGESSITFIEHTNSSGAGRAARSANIGVGNSSLPLSAAAPTGNPSTAGGASAVSTPPGPSITTASSAWGTGLRGCPLPLPTWHVRQQCSKPIATRATVLSARRVTLTNPAPPFATEELVWMTLSDGTTLKFHHGLTPSLHTPPPAPTLLASKHQVGVGGGETLQGTTASLHQQQHAAEATTTNSAALLPFSHRIPSCGSIVDLGSMAAATAAAVTNPSTTQNGSGFTTAQKKARRADEKLDALQQHVHVEMCTCHPLQTTGAAPSSSAASPMMSLNFPYPHPFTATAQQGNIAAGAAAGTTGGDLHHQRLLAGTPLAEFGRFEDGGGTCDNLSPLSSAYPFQNPPPQAQQHHAQGHQLHASGLDGITNGALFASCDTCGGRVQGKPYAMMSSAFNSVIEHLPLHHMRRSLVIPFSPVNSLSQIMTPNPIITPLSVGEGGSTTAGTTTTRQSVAAASASGRPRYIPLRHVTMTSLYHLLDAYSAHRLREEINSTSSSNLGGGGGDHHLFTADDAENNNAVGGDEQKHNNFLVVPTANSATTTRRQRTNQIRVADYYDSGGVAFKSEFEGVEATLEDLRKVFSEEDVKGGGESTEALNDADDEEEEGAGGGVSRSHSEQPAVSGGGVGDSGSKQHQAQNNNNAAALAAAASLATRVNLLRLYRAKPQQYLRQLMVLEAQDPSQWISSRTVFAKQLAEWSILQYLFDISCRCPAYFVVDLASGHITQLEVGLHALPATTLPTSAMTPLNPDASASGDFRSLPSSAASPSAAASSAATTGPRQFSLGSGEFSATFGGASSIRSNLATRDPTTFRMTTTLQNALPMRSPYSGFLLYASEGLRQAHLVKKELIGLLEYGLEGIRVRQLGQPTTAGQRQRRSGAFLSGRSSPASDFGAGVSASSYRAVVPVSYQTTANDGTPALALPPHARSTPAAVDAMSSARRATAAAIARRVSDSDGGLLSIEPFNSSFADSDQLLLRSNSPPAASGTADRQHSSNPRQPSQRKDDFNEDWAPSSAPSLEADEEGYSIACFDVSSAIVRLNESLSVASSSQTKQHYDPRRGVVVLSSPSLSPPPPKRPATTTTVSDSDAADAKNESLSNPIIPVEASLPTMFPSQPTARGSGAVTGAADSSSTTTRSVSPATHHHHLQPPPMLSTSSSGYYRAPYSSSATAHAPPTTAAAAHPLTKPLDSFEDFIGCMHSQAATKIQSFVRNRQRCRRLLVAARRLRRRQQQHNTLGAEPPLALDSEDEDEQATISLRTTSSFAGPHQRLFNMSLGSNEGADSRAGGTSGGSFSMMRPRTVSSSLLGQGGGGGSTGHAVGGGHPNSALQSPQLTFQAHLSTPVRQAANNTQSSNNDGDHEGGPEGTLQGEPSVVPQAAAAAGGQQQFEEDSPRPCSDVLIPGVTYHAVKTYQQRVESLIEAAVDEGNIAGRGWEHGQPHPWLVWCPFW
ncbi:Hypothetical protein, putative [Bodo saltans]|nr:Hypothetical protein, putative [Bodo saltans]|eukprot:CUI13028.1 Hypothetical protein, putative [Bodo saltans]